jgi:hypothetical protein
MNFVVRTVAAVLGPFALAACSYSLHGETESLRMEIVALEKRVPPESPLWISEGPDRFDQFIEDYSDHIPEHIYLHLVRKLSAMGVQEADSLSRGDFDFEACSKDPASFRGKFWRIHGLIGDLHPEAVKDAQSPVRTVHAGALFDDQMRPVFFHVVQKPDVLTLREDAVETRALFVKMVEYTTRTGRRVVAPFFMGKVLRRYL